jgi:hypothetical protein
MALKALRRVSERQMVRRSCLLVRGQMATVTSRGQPLAIELPHGADLVARITVCNRVGADERKTVLVLVDGMNGNLPPIHPVVKVALRPVFPPMKISVAILATAPHVGKNRIDVTFLARHFRVQAAQRVPGLAVIKVRFAADRSPGRGGVALLTSDFQRSVRADGRRRV